MARLVRLERDGPMRLEPQDKPVWICGCGLTRNFPFCDGTHKAACREEQPGTLYVYDSEGRLVRTLRDAGEESA